MYMYGIVFFFKQKTAYEIMPSLVGSEMCIRDRCCTSLPGMTFMKKSSSARIPAGELQELDEL